MPKITDIKEQKRKDRFNIYLDGKFAFALSAEALAKAGLVVDQEVSNKEIEKLRNQDIEGKLYNRVLGFLSYRPRSEKEVRDYLFKKISVRQSGYRTVSGQLADQRQSVFIESIVSRLKSLELIDDSDFTKWWIEQRQTFRPRGVYALRQELRQKGISEDLMAKWLNGYMAEKTELGGAQKAAHKRLKALKSLTPKETRQKLTRFLVYRGFSYPTIKLVLDEILTRE